MNHNHRCTSCDGEINLVAFEARQLHREQPARIVMCRACLQDPVKQRATIVCLVEELERQ